MTHLLSAHRNASLMRMADPAEVEKLGFSKKTLFNIWNKAKHKPHWENEHALADAVHSIFRLPWSKDAEIECGEYRRLERESLYSTLRRHKFSVRHLIGSVRSNAQDVPPTQTDWDIVVVAYSYLKSSLSEKSASRNMPLHEIHDYYSLCNRLLQLLRLIEAPHPWVKFLSLKIKTNECVVKWNRAPPAKRLKLRREFEETGLFDMTKTRDYLASCPRDFDYIYNLLAFASVMGITQYFDQLDIFLTEANGGRIDYTNRQEFDGDFDNFRAWLANRLREQAFRLQRSGKHSKVRRR